MALQRTCTLFERDYLPYLHRFLVDLRVFHVSSFSMIYLHHQDAFKKCFAYTLSELFVLVCFLESRNSLGEIDLINHMLWVYILRKIIELIQHSYINIT